MLTSDLDFPHPISISTISPEQIHACKSDPHLSISLSLSSSGSEHSKVRRSVLENINFCCRLRRAAWGRVWSSPGKPLGAALLCLILVSWKRSCPHCTLCWRMIIAVRGEAHGVPSHSLLAHKGCLTNMYTQCTDCAVYLSICLYLFQKIFFNTFFAFDFS